MQNEDHSHLRRAFDGHVPADGPAERGNPAGQNYMNINTYVQGTYGLPRSVQGTLTYRF